MLRLLQGGVLYAWDSWHTLVPLILGVVGLAAFILYEEKLAKEQLVRMVIFKNRTAGITFVSTVCHGIILWTLLFYLPLYYEAVKGQTPIMAGISLFPQTFTTAPVAIGTGIAISKTGRYRWAIWTGWAILTLGCGVMYLLDVHTSTPAWIFINLVSGIGGGILFPATAFPIQAATAAKNQAFAVSMYTFTRAFGQAIGVALGGTVFQNQMKQKLLKYPLLAEQAEQYSRDASSLVRIIQSMEDGLAKQQLVQAYADSLKVLWAVLCGLAFVAFLSSFSIKGLTLDQTLDTDQGFGTGGKNQIQPHNV